MVQRSWDRRPLALPVANHQRDRTVVRSSRGSEANSMGRKGKEMQLSICLGGSLPPCSLCSGISTSEHYRIIYHGDFLEIPTMLTLAKFLHLVSIMLSRISFQYSFASFEDFIINKFCFRIKGSSVTWASLNILFLKNKCEKDATFYLPFVQEWNVFCFLWGMQNWYRFRTEWRLCSCSRLLR